MLAEARVIIRGGQFASFSMIARRQVGFLDMKHQVHTSDLLTRLMNEAPKDTVDLDWLLGHLQKRAFGICCSS